MSDGVRTGWALLAGLLIVAAIVAAVSFLPDHKDRRFVGPVPSYLRR